MNYLTIQDREKLICALRFARVDDCKKLLKLKFRNYKKGSVYFNQELFRRNLFHSLISNSVWMDSCAIGFGRVTHRRFSENENRLNILKQLEADGRFPINYVYVAIKSIKHSFKGMFLHSLTKLSKDDLLKFICIYWNYITDSNRFFEYSLLESEPDLVRMVYEKCKKILFKFDHDCITVNVLEFL